MARPAGLSSDEEFSDDGLTFGDSPPTRRRTVLNDLVTNNHPHDLPVNNCEKLINAIIDENIEEVARILREEEVDLNSKPSKTSKWAPLLHACSLGSVEIVKLLLENGASVKVHFELQTPLMLVCDSMNKDENKLIECLEVLIKHGADVNALDWSHCNALSYAVKRGHQRLTLKLLSLECNINNIDGDGWTPIFYAVDSGNIHLVQILKDSGANLGLYDSRGRSLYDIAAMKDNKEITNMVSGIEKPLELDEIINQKQEAGMSNYKYVLSELPDRKKGRFYGFHTDVLKIVNGIGHANLIPIFMEKNVQLGELLTMNDQQLMKIGINMSFDRQKLLNSIQKFHERHWGKTCLGASFVDEEVTLFMAAQVLSNIARQVHVISTTTYYWNSNKTVKSTSKDIEAYIYKGLSYIELLYREIDLIMNLIKEIDKEQNIVPADLIKPAVEPKRRLGVRMIFIGVISSLIIYDYSSLKLFPSLLKSILNR